MTAISRTVPLAAAPSIEGPAGHDVPASHVHDYLVPPIRLFLPLAPSWRGSAYGLVVAFAAVCLPRDRDDGDLRVQPVDAGVSLPVVFASPVDQRSSRWTSSSGAP